MENIFNITYDNLENYFINIHDKKYRATQLYEYMYKKNVYDLSSMTNLSNKVKEGSRLIVLSSYMVCFR